MTAFIGIRGIKYNPEEPVGTGNWKSARIVHINPHYIKYLDENKMVLYMDDGDAFRIDEESLLIFLSAVYGEDKIRGDKLDRE